MRAEVGGREDDDLQRDCPIGDSRIGRVDANYAFTDADAVVGEVLAAFRSSLEAALAAVARG